MAFPPANEMPCQAFEATVLLPGHRFPPSVLKNYLSTNTRGRRKPRPSLPYSNKWAVRHQLTQAVKSFAEGVNLSFEDGYHKYPDDYSEANDPRDVFLADTSLWEGLLLNPPWEEKVLPSHVSFLARVAKSNWGHLFVVIPYRPTQP